MMRVRRAKAERQVDATAAHGLPLDFHIAVADALALGESLDSQSRTASSGRIASMHLACSIRCLSMFVLHEHMTLLP